MKPSNILNVLLAVALAILTVKTVFFKSGVKDAENCVINNIMSRTSVRLYEETPIENAKIEMLLKAAMAAPTAGNKQPWKFVVIKDKDILHSISANLNTMKMAENAPLAIVVCGDLDNTFPGDGRDYWVQDTSAATENLLLAAHASGLGAVWCGIYPMPERIEFLQQLLHLPGNIVPLNVIPIGYPADTQPAKDKWKPENIHYDTWSNAK